MTYLGCYSPTSITVDEDHVLAQPLDLFLEVIPSLTGLGDLFLEVIPSLTGLGLK